MGIIGAEMTNQHFIYQTKSFSPGDRVDVRLRTGELFLTGVTIHSVVNGIAFFNEVVQSVDVNRCEKSLHTRGPWACLAPHQNGFGVDDDDEDDEGDDDDGPEHELDMD